MKENIYRNFTLNNSLAAISAIPYENHTLATDGANCFIHKIDTEGSYLCGYNTLRPLRRIRLTDNQCFVTALGCCGDRRLYFLDENLLEKGFVELETPRIYRCSRQLSEITDASVITIGSQKFIAASFTKGAYLFDMKGNLLEKLCETEGDEILTDFVYLDNDTFAMVTLCENKQILTVSNGIESQNHVIDRNYVLRMLIPRNGEIYGLFGQNYIYNRIIKIFSENILFLQP